MKIFNFYSDPGHGWLKVPLGFLQKLYAAQLEIFRDELNEYAYIRKGKGNRDFVFLEEDCQAPAFIKAFEAEYGYKPTIRELPQANKSSKIRNYDFLVFERDILPHIVDKFLDLE